jgi:hypothetical protein
MCHAACIRGAFSDAFAIAKPSNNGKRTFTANDAKRFFMFKDVTCRPTDEQIELKGLSLAKLPVVRKEEGPAGRGRGAGPTFYEALKSGTMVKLNFIHPTKNFITPEEMCAWLKRLLPFMPMSHARHSQGYGAMKLVEFKYRYLEGDETGWQEIEVSAEE